MLVFFILLGIMGIIEIRNWSEKRSLQNQREKSANLKERIAMAEAGDPDDLTVKAYKLMDGVDTIAEMLHTIETGDPDDRLVQVYKKILTEDGLRHWFEKDE